MLFPDNNHQIFHGYSLVIATLCILASHSQGYCFLNAKLQKCGGKNSMNLLLIETLTDN